jgi:hypothetical protein
MYHPSFYSEDGRLVLGVNHRRIREWLPGAERRVRRLRRQVDELDMAIHWARGIVHEAGATVPWVPVTGPSRPLTLHRAMAIVLQSHSNEFMWPREIAAEVAQRGLYRRRDGMPPTVRDVSARASAYPGLFERHAYTIRLRLPTNRSPIQEDRLSAGSPFPAATSFSEMAPVTRTASPDPRTWRGSRRPPSAAPSARRH